MLHLLRRPGGDRHAVLRDGGARRPRGPRFQHPRRDARPSARAMYDSMNDVLARLHRVDWQAVGLAGFGRPGNYFARQISRWTRQWHASKTREIPEIDHLIAWLPAHLPAGDDETTIVHGDFRLGNLMFHPTRAAGDRDPRLGALDARPSARRPRPQLPALARDACDVLRHRGSRPGGARHPRARQDYVRALLRAHRAQGRPRQPSTSRSRCSASR